MNERSTEGKTKVVEAHRSETEVTPELSISTIVLDRLQLSEQHFDADLVRTTDITRGENSQANTFSTRDKQTKQEDEINPAAYKYLSVPWE